MNNDIRLDQPDSATAQTYGDQPAAMPGPDSAAATVDAPDGPAWDRQRAWFAVATTLAIAWFPYLAVVVLYWIFTYDTENWPYVANSLYEVTQQSAIIVVMLFIMACDGRPWSTFGIRRPRLLLDPLIAVLIVASVWVMFAVLYAVIGSVVGSEAIDQFSESSYQFELPESSIDLVLLIVLSMSTGLSEELTMRGYLIPTFERLLNSRWMSVLLTSGFFASYHLYQGVGPMMWIFALGILYGAVFCWQRRLWPLVVAHAMMDVIGLYQDW